MNYEMTSEFAPAERLAVATVLSQVKSLSDKGAIPSLIESMPVMVMVLNAQRQCVHANKALLDFLGITDPMVVL
ncbi:MAG: PAS domain-containing protein, partial [Candidatus Brocadiia bacterium]